VKPVHLPELDKLMAELVGAGGSRVQRR